jgi:hypothetical protein
MTTRIRAAATALVAMLWLGCSGTSLPPEGPARPLTSKPAPTAPPPPVEAPSRWVESSGGAQIGLSVGGKTMVSLGGRMLVAAADGSVTAATSRLSESVGSMIRVFTAGGEGRTFALGEAGIYRLDDAFGARRLVARLPGESQTLGGAPGALAVETMDRYGTFSGEASFFDVDTLKPAKRPRLPDLPVRAVMFRNPREGAALVDLVGLVQTTDGGVSWQPVGPMPPQNDPEMLSDPLYIGGLHLYGDTVSALVLVYAAGYWDAPIDFAKGALTLAPKEIGTTGLAALTQLLAEYSHDPLDLAVSEGVMSAPGEALVALRGMIARIDVRTGMPLEILPVARRSIALINGCMLTRTRDAAWVLCATVAKGTGKPGGLERATGEESADGVFRVPLGTGKLGAEKQVALEGLEIGAILASPSGGVMLWLDQQNDVLVRQPDGKWARVAPRFDLGSRGGGPLSDGRVAFLEGLSAEDGLPEGVLHVMAIDAAGKEKRIATIPWGTAPAGGVVVQSRIEEGEDHTLRLILGNASGARLVTVTPGDDSALITTLAGAKHARLKGKYGIALGPGRLSASTDSGRTWTELGMTAGVRENMARALAQLDKPSDSDPYDIHGVLAVSEVGAKIDEQLRVGWGAEEAAPAAEPKAVETAEVAAIGQDQGASTRVLACTTTTRSKGSPPAPAASRPTPKGTRRVLVKTRDGLGPAIVMEIDGPDGPEGAPASFRLSFHDPASPGSKLQTASGPAPGGLSWDLQLGVASLDGARLLLSFRSAEKHFVARTKGTALETVEVAAALGPWAEVGQIGIDKDGAGAWVAGGALVLWPEKGAPRAIAPWGTVRYAALGLPAADGVTVVVSGQTSAWWQTLPVPAATGDGPGVHPLGVWLSGWKPVPSLEHPEDLPACAATSKGARVRSEHSDVELVLDALAMTMPAALYEMRVLPGEACLSRVTLLARSDPPAPSAAPSIVRIELPANSGEAGQWDRQSLPRMTQKLSCGLTKRSLLPARGSN